MFSVKVVEDYLKEFRVGSFKSINSIPVVSLEYDRDLPKCWYDVLKGDTSLVEFLSCAWEPVKHVMPKTINILKDKLKQLVVLEGFDGEDLSLIYIFTEYGDLRLRIGRLPYEKALPASLSRLNLNLQSLFQVHNGFNDLISGDTGYLSVNDIFSSSLNIEESGGYIEIFRSGPNSLVVDLSDDFNACVIWGAEEEVEQIDDFWSELDNWICSGIEDFDDRIGAG